jgi:hypothetical protein
LNPFAYHHCIIDAIAHVIYVDEKEAIMQFISNFDKAMKVLGGPSAVARLLGINAPAVCAWRKRDRKFPPQWYAAIADALAAEGYDPADELFRFGKRPRRK